MGGNSEIQEIESSQRDPGRWKTLYSVIVAVLAPVLDCAQVSSSKLKTEARFMGEPSMGAAVVAAGAVLAWFTFRNGTQRG